MSIVEIRTNDGVLLVGRPGGLPAFVLRAGDKQSLQARLRRLPANVQALDQVRRKWRALGMSISATTLDDAELVNVLRRKLSSGQVEAVFLRDAPLPPGVEIKLPEQSPVLHVQLPGMTVLITGKGQMPGEFMAYRDRRSAVEALKAIAHGSPAAKAIDAHAHRLPGGTVKAISGPPLVQHIAHQIEAGGHDAVVLTHPAVIAQAAARPDAPKSIAQMDMVDKVIDALQRSIKHLPAELATAAAITVIMEIGIALASLIPLQAVPIGGEIADAIVLGAAYLVAGVAGVMAVWQLVNATYTAARATKEEELEEAAKEFAAAFVAFGLAKLMKFRAKLLEGKPSGAAAKAEGTAGRSGGAATRQGGKESSTRQPHLEHEPALKKQQGSAAVAPVPTAETEAARLIKSAVDAEPELTRDITTLTREARGDMAGLEYRLKTEESLARKIATDMEKGGLTAEEAAGRIVDTNRYTAIFPTDDMVGGYEKVIKGLEAKGYKVTKVKNTWDDPTVPYNGVNVQLVSPNGQPVELQFHTPESFWAKDAGTHALYEEQRKLEKGSARWQELEQQQRDIFKQTPRPPGVEKITPYPK